MKQKVLLPWKKDDLEEENIIEDVGIGAIDNVPENRIEEDVTGTIDEDDEDHDNHTSNDDDKENLDIPIIKNAYKPLYEDSQTTLLSVVLLPIKFKVMNGISNVAISRMLRYSVIFVISYVSIPLMFFILKIFFVS